MKTVATQASGPDFEWDNENISHLERHQIEPAEVEELFRNEPLIKSHERG